MAKAKPKSDSGIPGLDPDDIAAFRHDLAGDGEPAAANLESPQSAVEPSTDRPTARPGRRIRVTQDPVSKKSRPVTSGKSVDEIHSVWHGDQPPVNPPTSFQKARRRGPWGWIIGGLLALAAVSIAGWFFFNRSAKFTGNNIQVVVNAPKQVASGGDVAITIDYQNQESVDLTSAQLSIEYPTGFTYTSSSVQPSNEFKNAFPIGRIASGHAGELTIHGTIVGSLNTELTITATLTYRPANFSSDFQEQGSATIKISSSILTLAIGGPDKLAPGASGSWTMTISNTSDHDIQKIRLDVVAPAGLSITKATPAATDGATGWVIDKVAKGQNTVITVTGTASGNLGDSLELKGNLGLINDAGSIDPQDQQSLLIILVNTGLTTTIAVNGQTDPTTLSPGDTLNYTIKVANKGDVEVADVTITATLGGSGLDLTTLANPLKGTVKNSTVTWTKAQVPGLALLTPGHDLSVSLSVGTAKTLTVTKDSDRNPNVNLSVVASAPSLVSNTNTAVAPIVALTKYVTVFTVKADARYYDDSQVAVGSGPVPPVVGKTTSYRVTWSVTNTTSDATAMVVSTLLPVGVLWTGQNVGRDAGDIAFDPNSRKVTWTLNTVPAGTGSRLPTLTAHFDVSITPTSDQVGSVVVLTDTTTATATDSYSGKSLTSTASSLTTDVPNDPQAAGEGKVVAK